VNFLGAECGLAPHQVQDVLYCLTDPKWGVMTLPLLFSLDKEDITECLKPIEAFAVKKLVTAAVLESKK
jgi:hypothetical protein